MEKKYDVVIIGAGPGGIFCAYELKEKKPELKLEDVRAVLAEKSRAGHTAAIRTLLQKYGASKLSAVDPKHYEALIKDAEVLDDAT